MPPSQRTAPLDHHIRHHTHAWFGPTHWPLDTVAKAFPSPVGDPWCPCYLILLHNHVYARSRAFCGSSVVSEEHGAPPSTAVCPCSPRRPLFSPQVIHGRQPSVLAAPLKPTSHVARERSTASNSFPHLPVGTPRGSLIVRSLIWSSRASSLWPLPCNSTLSRNTQNLIADAIRTCYA